MSSLYSIVEADLQPGLISKEEYDRCLANPGGTAATLTKLVDQAEGLLHGAAGGAPTGAAAQALFRPYAIVCVLYQLHARRAQQDNAKIPEIVAEDWKNAQDWAKDVGQRLLAEEKAAGSAAGGIPVTQVQEPVFTREKMKGW